MNNYKKLLFTSLTGLAALGFYACGAGETGPQGEKGEVGRPGASCTLTANEDGSSTISCPDGNSFTVKNGENGLPGDAGSDGKNGTSCTINKNEDGDYNIICDGHTVGTITNGTNGVGCSVMDEGDGSVTITCGEGDDATTTTIYKAVCGTKPYDPLKAFCSDGEVYDLCGGKTYEPKKQFCDTRDNQIYGYVTIAVGDYAETWMAENLNYSVIPDEQSWCGGGSGTTEGDCSVYGRLYTWAAAVGKSEDECGYGHECDLIDAKNEKGEVRGVCPEGWHLPSKDEWSALITAVGGTDVAGKNLKADSDLWTQEDGISNDDSYGFSALPAGDRYLSGDFYDAGSSAYFWSASQKGSDSNYAYYVDLDYDYEGAYLLGNYKDVGFSVRCLRDQD